MSTTHPIRLWREYHGITLKEAAARFDVSKGTVCRWEMGQRNVDSDRLPLISRVTGIPAEALRPDLAALLKAVG